MRPKGTEAARPPFLQKKRGGVVKKTSLCFLCWLSFTNIKKSGETVVGFSALFYSSPYGILIPKKGDSESAKYGEIMQGYYKWGMFTTIFHKRIIRRPVYGLYDTFARPDKPKHPAYKSELDASVV